MVWLAKCIGSSVTVETVSVPNWREALGAVLGLMKHAAAPGTLQALIAESVHALPDKDWSVTDGVCRFSIVQLSDEVCRSCGGNGYVLSPPGSDNSIPCDACNSTGASIPPVNEVMPENAVCIAAMTGAFDCEWPGCGCETGYAPTPAHIGSGITHCPPAVVTVLEPDHTAREHSELGASIAERWMNCPASVRLVRGEPNPSSPEADRGTATHEVAHMCLLSGHDAIEYVGRIVNGIEIDDVIADGVQMYLDNCRAHDVSESHFEVRFNLESLDAPAPMFGTADYVGYDMLEQILYVDDYKNGFVYVDAKTPQLKYYALGAMLWLGDDKPVSQVVVTICQPNGLGLALKTDTFDAVELVEWSQDLMTAARRALDPASPAVPGPWCAKPGKACPVAGKCAVHADHVLTAARVDSIDYLSPMTVPEVRMLTQAEAGAVVGAAPMLRDYLNAVEALVRRNPEGTGWKVVPTNPQEVWVDEAEAAMTLQLEHGIADPFEPPAPIKTISPATARGLIKESLHASRVASHTTGRKPTKKAAEADAHEMLGSLLTKRSGGTKLVPDADPRPAILTNGAEFDDLKVQNDG